MFYGKWRKPPAPLGFSADLNTECPVSHLHREECIYVGCIPYALAPTCSCDKWQSASID